MPGCHVRMCPNMSKLNFGGRIIRAWNELVLKRDKNEILKFWKSEVGFELKSLTLIEKDIISLIIFILDERRRLPVIHFAHTIMTKIKLSFRIKIRVNLKVNRRESNWTIVRVKKLKGIVKKIRFSLNYVRRVSVFSKPSAIEWPNGFSKFDGVLAYKLYAYYMHAGKHSEIFFFSRLVLFDQFQLKFSFHFVLEITYWIKEKNVWFWKSL